MGEYKSRFEWSGGKAKLLLSRCVGEPACGLITMRLADERHSETEERLLAAASASPSLCSRWFNEPFTEI